MKKYKFTMLGIAVIAALSVLTVSNESLAEGEKSLYDSIGGNDGVSTVIDNFLTNVGGDDRINARFSGADMDNLRRLLIEQVCEATGGPCAYSGMSMLDTHKGMGITEDEFGALAGQFSAAMNTAGVSQEDHDTIMGVLGGMHDDIVGQ